MPSPLDPSGRVRPRFESISCVRRRLGGPRRKDGGGLPPFTLSAGIVLAAVFGYHACRWVQGGEKPADPAPVSAPAAAPNSPPNSR